MFTNDLNSDLHPRPDLRKMPVEINCTTFLSGTLNYSWTVGDYVELVTLDYNCTGFGEDQVSQQVNYLCV